MVETGGIKDYLLLGRFSSGKRDGQWVQWYRNGQKEVEGIYYRGKKHGEWTLWYNNGTQKERGQFDMGKVDGSYKYWYANGHLHMEQTYHKGKSHGKWAWWFEHDHNLTFTMGPGPIMVVLIKPKITKNSGTGGGISMIIKKWKGIISMVEKMVFGPGGTIQA